MGKLRGEAAEAKINCVATKYACSEYAIRFPSFLLFAFFSAKAVAAEGSGSEKSSSWYYM